MNFSPSYQNTFLPSRTQLSSKKFTEEFFLNENTVNGHNYQICKELKREKGHNFKMSKEFKREKGYNLKMCKELKREKGYNLKMCKELKN